MKNSKYIKLGALIVCCITILVWGINYLKGIDIFKSSTTYYVKYNRVDGLVKSSSIFINGFQVGLVQDVSFSDANDGSFLVELSIEGDFKIPKGSSAVLTSSDLLGTKSVKLIINPNKEYYAEGDTLSSSIDDDMLELLGNEVMPLKEKAERLIMSLDSTTSTLNTILDAKTQENLKQSVSHFNTTMRNMEEVSYQFNHILKSRNINNIINNVDTITNALASSSSDFNKISSNLSSISDSLAASSLKTTADKLTSILSKIENGDGSLGSLVNNKDLYNNLDELTTSLNQILIDFRNNPSKYLKFTGVDFGKDIYISSNDLKNNDGKYSFRIHLIDSDKPISLDDSRFNNLEVEELIHERIYSYFTKEQGDFPNLERQFTYTKRSFPNAEIVAYKNGKFIKLNKAIKELSK